METFTPSSEKGPPLHKCKFTTEEDAQLSELVRLHGEEDWMTISCLMPGRNPRQCRERWRHYLSPAVSLAPFAPDEDARLLHKYAELGPKWKAIAAFFEGRTDINVKNRWLLLGRHQRRAEAAADDVTAAPRGLLRPVRVPEKQPVPPPPRKSLLDIPWSDEDQHEEKAKYTESAELTGDYFCLSFACYE
jgi:hypothetical protein